MDAAVTTAFHQTGLFQNNKMFGDGGKGHGVGTGEIGDAFVALGQLRENAAAGGIGEGGECAVEQLRFIFNHMVEYIPK